MCILSRHLVLPLLVVSLTSPLATSDDICTNESSEAAGSVLLSLSHRRFRLDKADGTKKVLHQERENESLAAAIRPAPGEQSIMDVAFNGQQMRSTANGICMYTLPPQFNLDLLDSTFAEPEPPSWNISPPHEPPLQGMFDTSQFSLERIFFDRMDVEATEIRPAEQCAVFYVPYFASWETAGYNGVWKTASRPELEHDLLSHLTYFNAANLQKHFIVIGRVTRDVLPFLQNAAFKNMAKLVLEDTEPGTYSNIFPVPYPTWFRYYPSLEPAQPTAIQPTIYIDDLTYKVQEGEPENCNSTAYGDLLSRMRTDCHEHSWCSFFLMPLSDQQTGCPIHDVVGTYTCGANATPSIFRTTPGEVSSARAVVLSCNAGPYWLWDVAAPSDNAQGGEGINMAILSSNQTKGKMHFTMDQTQQRVSPLATMIGSAWPAEHERTVIFNMCQERPNLCADFKTGIRTNSSSSVPGRISDMYQLLMASTFCIQPPGDTPTRKGLFDSLVLGCIPVITSEDSLQHYSMHIDDWKSISVLVTTDQLFAGGFNIFDYLADYAINDPRGVQEKQRAIQQVAYSIQYSLKPAANTKHGPDAFEKILQHVLSPTPSLTSKYIASGINTLASFDIAGEDTSPEFGAVNISLQEVYSNWSSETVWQVRGRGDGVCCYRIVDVLSGESLADEPSYAEVTSLVSGIGHTVRGSDTWRFTPKGEDEYIITNVASGRRLISREGGFGGSRSEADLNEPIWKIKARSNLIVDEAAK